MHLIFQAIILGLIQGLSEFLPISSSGHLIIVPAVMGWDHFGQTFDVALHVGTALALLVYFWRDLMAVFFAGQSYLVEICGRGRFVAFLVISAIPAAIVGKLFDKRIEEWFDEPEHKAMIFLFIGSTMLGFGLLLGLADQFGAKEKGEEAFGWAALGMGLAQALALFPGVSRSGVTTTAALFMGVRRDSAARFSFLISLPVICGAALLKLVQSMKNPSELLKGIAPVGSHAYGMAAMVYGSGVIFSALSGFLVMKYLIRYLGHGSFRVFVAYRLLVGAVLIAWGYHLLR